MGYCVAEDRAGPKKLGDDRNLITDCAGMASMGKTLNRAAALSAVAVATIAVGTASVDAASAAAPATKTVTWLTPRDASLPLPSPGVGVWPQTRVDSLPACSTKLYQVDTYRYSTPADKATVDKIVASGVLEQPGTAGSDSSVLVSYRYVKVPECAQVASISSTDPTSSLPFTGADGGLGAGVGGALLIAGGAFMLLGRRRRA